MSDFSDSIYGVPSDVTSGWSALGRVLGGGGAVRQNAYQRGVMQGAQTADVMEQARRRRDQNLGFTGITPEVMKAAMAGDPDARAQMASSALHGGVNLDTLGGGVTKLVNLGQEQGEYAQAQGGAPLSAINAELAVRHGQPLKLSEVQGNTLLNPYTLPNEQDAVGGNVPTAVGQSDIARAMAEATQAKAGAFRNTAEGQHALSEMVMPITDATGHTQLLNRSTGKSIGATDATGQPLQPLQKGTSPGQLSDPKPMVLDQALGKPLQGGKPNPAYEQFKTYQALHAQSDPAFNNGDYALAQYLLAKQGTEMAGKYASTTVSPEQVKADQTGRAVTDEDGHVIASPLSFSHAMQEAAVPNGTSNPQPAPDTQPKKAAPTVGTVEQGYQYIGGDPAQPTSWRKVS